MSIWMQLLVIAGAALVLWILYRGIKGNPQMYSRENISKSFSTMGVLALILIAFVAFCVVLLRAS